MISHIYSHDELRELIVPMLPHYGMKSAKLFGSYARNEATSTSDIDVLLEGNPGFSPLNVFAMAEELREKSGKDVDMYELSELSDGPFRNAVFKDAVQL
ncbi:nucleotidyltransferase family protein [Bifidobacterium oedipodis]|uniref:Toxin-antitoxin system toxin subunit n=1 Tax=Bifidobacterium oedipodis TaxID=2675322 RepID=A0A7Y0EMS4_9BIFI|nr:nucleotidyltransferase domain-containing protein [Bifidobacterium sp. DSM 109957]NMM93110.1 toxin-antitoxin system toxin subunit [Bifidobacterium sp. DSM 109957]